MTPQEQKAIRERAAGIGAITLRLRLTADPQSAALEAFCRDLAALAPGVRVKKQDHNETLPGFWVGDNVCYRAVPEGLELSPFLDFLEGVESGAGLDHLPASDMLDRIRVPAHIQVFVSPHCPNCPETVASVLLLARRCPKISVTVVDGLLFADLAAAANVRSAPTVILEDRFRWAGAVDLMEILRMIDNRDPAQLGVQALQQMIESGDAEALARMMAERDAVFPAFVDLLIHPKWPVRLGAMVSFEFLNDNRRDLAVRVLEMVWARFSGADEDVRGDILYLLGESGQPEMADRLRAVVVGDYPEPVREAAGDALAALMERDETP